MHNMLKLQQKSLDVWYKNKKNIFQEGYIDLE